MPVTLVSHVPVPLRLWLLRGSAELSVVRTLQGQSGTAELLVGDLSGWAGAAPLDDCLEGPVFLPEHFIWKSTTRGSVLKL